MTEEILLNVRYVSFSNNLNNRNSNKTLLCCIIGYFPTKKNVNFLETVFCYTWWKQIWRTDRPVLEILHVQAKRGRHKRQRRLWWERRGTTLQRCQ